MKHVLSFILVFSAAVLFGQDWIPAKGGEVPQWATPAGYEADGTALFIIRTPFSGGVHIGKVNPKHSSGYIPWGGKENLVSDYEVYSGGGRWVKGTDRKVPEGAVEGGKEADGTPLYIIRAPVGGGLHPGKFNPKYKTAYVPYGGKEIELKEYEMLVDDWLPLQGMKVPSNAFKTGAEAKASPYIIRAKQGGGVYPGKLSPGGGKGYIPYNGREIELKSGMEIFVGSGQWVEAGEGNVPFGAVRGGTDDRGNPLFLARARHSGGIHAGKVNPSTGQASVPYGGREVTVDRYEVLVYDFGGKIKAPDIAAVPPDRKDPPKAFPEPPRPATATPLPAGDLRSSIKGDRPAELVLVNETALPLQLVWFDYAGNPVPYGTVDPGNTLTQKSYETHVWLVKSSAGYEYGYYILGPEPRQELTVKSSSPKPAGSLRKSTKGEQPVNLILINDTSIPLQLIWFDYAGKQVPYGKIDPGKSIIQRSYETHVWLAKSANGHEFGYYVLGPERQQELIIQAGR